MKSNTPSYQEGLAESGKKQSLVLHVQMVLCILLYVE